MKTLLDSEPPLSRAERADALLDQLKRQDEALFEAVVARMAKDEDFRRRVLAAAKALGKGRRGGQVQNQAMVDSIVRNLTSGGADEKETIRALKGTLRRSAKQARRLYDKAPASTSTTSRIHRIRK